MRDPGNRDPVATSIPEGARISARSFARARLSTLERATAIAPTSASPRCLLLVDDVAEGRGRGGRRGARGEGLTKLPQGRDYSETDHTLRRSRHCDPVRKLAPVSLRRLPPSRRDAHYVDRCARLMINTARRLSHSRARISTRTRLEFSSSFFRFRPGEGNGQSPFREDHANPQESPRMD